jgi:hypothetical protein
VPRPIRITFRFSARSAPVAILLGVGAVAAVLALLVGLHALPVALFGDPLTEREAERAIRLHLRAQTAARREAALPAVEVIDVDKSIFGLFSFKGWYVAEARMQGGGGRPATRYFCFVSHALLGECGAWRWRLAL